MLLTGVGAPPAFTPLALPNLVGWWRADSGVYQDAARTTPAVADADPVGGRLDHSASAAHASQATGAARPTLKLAIVNGQPVIRYDGVDDWETVGNPAFFKSTAATWSVFALVRLASIAPVRQFVLARDHDTLGRYAGLGLFGNRLYVEFAGVPTHTGSIDLATDTPYLLEWHNDASGNTFEQRVNGTADGAGVAGVGQAATAAVYIGGRSYPDNLNPLTGDLGHLVVTGALSATDKTNARTWLKAAWGIA